VRRRVLPVTLRVLLFAAIGAAATVLVAWGCVPHPFHERRSTELSDRWPARWPTFVPRHWPPCEHIVVVRAVGWKEAIFVGRTKGEHTMAIITQSGWPLTAMCYWDFFQGSNGSFTASGRGGLWRADLKDSSLWFPLEPLWPGFLVDTAFWSGAAFLCLARAGVRAAGGAAEAGAVRAVRVRVEGAGGVPRVRGWGVRQRVLSVTLRVLLFAAIGAAMTVLVAWSFALRTFEIASGTALLWLMDPRTLARDEGYGKSPAIVSDAYGDPSNWYVQSHARTGVTGRTFRVDMSPAVSPREKASFDRLAGDNAVARAMDRHLPLLARSDAGFTEFHVWSFGWPTRCLALEESSTAERMKLWKMLVITPRHPIPSPNGAPPPSPWATDETGLRANYGVIHVGDRIVPILPLWPGFLVDTAFWGGAAFVVWSGRGGAGFVRRGVRRRRGRCVRCVRCGYELKGLAVCPECGVSP
jgi:hypothetical protein